MKSALVSDPNPNPNASPNPDKQLQYHEVPTSGADTSYVLIYIVVHSLHHEVGLGE
jgi:hypothetical protein